MPLHTWRQKHSSDEQWHADLATKDLQYYKERLELVNALLSDVRC